MNTTTTKTPTLISALRERRSARAARRALARELHSFQTPAERLELDAMLDRAHPHHAEYLREVLNARRVA